MLKATSSFRYYHNSRNDVIDAYGGNHNNFRLKNIASFDATIHYPGISILDKKLTDNPNYLFLYINIDKETKQADYLRGFGYQGEANRIKNVPEGLVGEELKSEIFKPGGYYIRMTCFG